LGQIPTHFKSAPQFFALGVVFLVKKGRRDTVLARFAPGLWIQEAGGAGSIG